MTTKELRTAAADYIESHGWIQGMWNTTDGAVCMVGALAQAVSGRAPRKAATTELRRELCLGEYTTLISWNDRPGRTKDEVLAALRGTLVRP